MAGTLIASCLHGWHKTRFVQVIVEGREIKAREWEAMAAENRRGFGFPRTLRLYCAKCGRDTRHAPRRVG